MRDRRPLAPVFNGGTHSKASHVEAEDTDTTRYEVPSHGQAYGSEADKANRRHRFTFPTD
jgi:hypothetical protein